MPRAPADASIVTRMRFAAPPERAWAGLVFFEQIADRPPLHLRLLLPRPIRTEGCKTEVGDEVRCVYEEGFLLKRVTCIDPCRRYGFEIGEQHLAVGGGMRLTGGAYTLRALPDGNTEMALETRYVSPRRPRWLWRSIEAAIGHSFHRHILGAIRRKAESRCPPAPSPAAS